MKITSKAKETNKILFELDNNQEKYKKELETSKKARKELEEFKKILNM